MSDADSLTASEVQTETPTDAREARALKRQRELDPIHIRLTKPKLEMISVSDAADVHDQSAALVTSAHPSRYLQSQAVEDSPPQQEQGRQPQVR